MAPKRERIFLDTSVFIAAAGSPSGGSSLVLAICQGRRFAAVTSRKILLEAQRNIRKKLPGDALLHFYKEIASLNPKITKPPTQVELDKYQDIIALKDLHVLAAALKSKARFLITLDRKHFLTQAIERAGLPITIMTPKDFLGWLREKYEPPEKGQ